MFKSCFNIPSLEPLRNWDVSNGTNFEEIFKDCNNVNPSEELSNWGIF